MRKGVARSSATLFLLYLLALPAVLAADRATAAAGEQGQDEEEVTNPYIGQQDAIEQGKEIYRRRCVGCHYRRGGRGPNLYESKLTDEQFLETVINGRHGTRGVMPAFGYVLSPDDVWKIQAFIESGESF